MNTNIAHLLSSSNVYAELEELLDYDTDTATPEKTPTATPKAVKKCKPHKLEDLESMVNSLYSNHMVHEARVEEDARKKGRRTQRSSSNREGSSGTCPRSNMIHFEQSPIIV
jgi:hypothetical protein